MQITQVSAWLVNYTMRPLCSTALTVFVSSCVIFSYNRSELYSFEAQAVLRSPTVPGSFMAPKERSPYGRAEPWTERDSLPQFTLIQ